MKIIFFPLSLSVKVGCWTLTITLGNEKTAGSKQNKFFKKKRTKKQRESQGLFLGEALFRYALQVLVANQFCGRHLRSERKGSASGEDEKYNYSEGTLDLK